MMATATATATTTKTTAELPPTQPRSWKNRFMRRGSNNKETPKGGGTLTSRFISNDGTENSSEKSNGCDPSTSVASPNGSGNSKESAAQSMNGKRSLKTKKGSTGLIRKLKSLNGSFRHPKEGGGESGGQVAAQPLQESESSPSNPQSPYSTESFATVETESSKKEKIFDWKEAIEERERRELIYRKQDLKERDGFCRRVDTYDGQVVVVDQVPTYELGNYLGGGVAGVVYEGHRLRPIEEYPVRTGVVEHDVPVIPTPPSPEVQTASFFCAPVDFVQTTAADGPCGELDESDKEEPVSPSSTAALPRPSETKKKTVTHEDVDVAIEATVSQNEHGVLLDAQDAPSRSKHYAKAASITLNPMKSGKTKSLQHGLQEETVAIKILNPVGYRILPSEALEGAVVVKKGEAMDKEVKKGIKPMQENHVWWLVNPNSRNLRTLQRYSGNGKGTSDPSSQVAAPRGIQVDRGTAEKGLRLSLIAAYIDPRTNLLRELTLTRCIEIWGHVPFSATDTEFEDMMTAIERINAGQPPPPFPFGEDDQPPSRVGTGATDSSNSRISADQDSRLNSPVALGPQRTGLLRAALTSRVTVFCESLNAYIAVPAVPSKYLRWLRQRRAATKEIRNMMLIGRHKNVVHLFEVLEYIQDSKSTMFLILELVRGGELFDLISSSAANKNKHVPGDGESERMMRRFFYELASGIYYCHSNGIAHRDLKPENLLVHNGPEGHCTLKIADFGLSAAFGPNGQAQMSDVDTMVDSLGSPLSASLPSFGGGDLELSFGSTNRPAEASPTSQASHNSSSPIKESMDKIIQTGANALSFLTCGAMETVLCVPNQAAVADTNPSPLRRMTSVVGSPHYVAPEIISQSDEPRRSSRTKTSHGYDGSKADVWSAGVILYAMLFRSLPFGEDLLRCPRYQSYRKWYDDVRELGGRRSSAIAALSPKFTDTDEREMLGPHWFFPSATSRESRDLIVAMLNPDPRDRLTVHMVLQHPWLAKEKSAVR